MGLVTAVHYSSTGTTELLENEKMLVINAVPKVSCCCVVIMLHPLAPPTFCLQPFSDEDINMLYNVLGQVHVPDNDSDDDLRAKEDLKVSGPVTVVSLCSKCYSCD